LNEKCRQLVSTQNGILAATNRGLFVINNHKAIPVAENRYINFISWQPADNKYYVAAGDGYFSVKYQDGKWYSGVPDPDFTDPVYSVLKAKNNNLWIGLGNEALIADLSNSSDSVIYTAVKIKHDFLQHYSIADVHDSVFLFTESGIYSYDEGSNEFIITGSSSVSPGTEMKYVYPLSNLPWIKNGDNWNCLQTGNRILEKEKSLLKIFSDVISINAEEAYLWVIDGENRLFRIDLNKQSNINPGIDVFVKSIYDERGNTFDLSNIVSKRGNNIFYFDIVAPGYLKQRTTQYQYTINKLMTDWSPWSVQTNYNLMISLPGEYTLQVRAKDLWGNIGAPKSIKFTIEAPFTQTTFFYVLIGVVIIVILIFFIRFRERQLQRKNKLLEEKVRDRTAEIAAQKEEITSSIEYASRIQRAMLPMEDHFTTFFSDYFIIFKPRDIVSGDFYWIGEGDENVFFTVADCTGHGVPGAFMSTLGISTLNEIITNNDDLHANTILNVMRNKIKTSLHQTGKEGEAADGMDLAFCVMNKNKKTLQYAGAYNPLFIFQRGKLKEYKADRMPIGIHYGEKESFANHEIKIRKGDTLYIFSDGLNDQFGGPGGSKYKIANLKKLLTRVHAKPMAEQRKIIEREFEKWRGSAEQVDDITMVGVRI
jgi:serine phosphatase RsbU (regulator of sigma subunit)